MHAVVLGCGSWGTALSLLLARNGLRVSLWGRDEDDIRTIARERENPFYLPGFPFPAEVEPVLNTPNEADLWVLAVPSEGMREVCARLPVEPLVVMASKGLEPNTGCRMSEIVAQERPSARVCVLSGPNLALELAKGIPTATVIASTSESCAGWTRERFMCRSFRVYTSSDVAGVELGGALKNVMALGAGMSDGLGFGDNTKGALLARGLYEICELGAAMGAQLKTFLGLSGVGDLFATAASRLSRNYRVGRLLGEGYGLVDALNEIGQVAEGVPTSEAAVSLAQRNRVEVPLIEAINRVVAGKTKPIDAVAELMERSPKAEV